MMLPPVGFVIPDIFLIVQWFSQKLKAHKLNMIKDQKPQGPQLNLTIEY